MKSIQRQLTYTLLVTVLTLSASAGAFLYWFARSRLVAEFARGLSTEARSVASAITRESTGELEFSFSDADRRRLARERHPVYFEVWYPDGRVFARSPSLRTGDLKRPIGAAGNHAFDSLDLPGNRRGYSTMLQFVPHTDPEDEAAIRSKPPGQVPEAPLMTVVLAREPHELNQTLWVLGSSLCLAGLALAAGTVLAVTLAVRRGLVPLHRLAAEADAIGAESLHERFSSQSLPEELRPICSRLNGLLDRLAEAFARERRFTSDAAHELRTPIAELRAMAEVALRWPQDARPEQTYRDTLAIANQMEVMVTMLLSIARCEAGLIRPQMASVDLANLLQEAWEFHRSAAAGRNLVATLQLAPGALVESDRALLLPLIGNLVSNAFAHTPDGGSVEAQLQTAGANVELTISNTCISLLPEDLAHLSEPFWRKDAARTDGCHCGLGLSLVSAYAKALGVVHSNDLEAGRFRTTLTLARSGTMSPVPAGGGVLDRTWGAV